MQAPSSHRPSCWRLTRVAYTFALLVAGVALIRSDPAHAEWTDDKATVAKAEGLMLDFIATKGGPERWAAFGRGESWGLRDQGQRVHEMKFFTLMAKSKAEPDASYFSHGIVNQRLNGEYQGLSTGGQWFQTLRSGTRRFLASGGSTVYHVDEVDDDDLILGTERKHMLTFRPFNPFTACVAPFGALLHGSVDTELPQRLYMLNATLALAEEDDFRGVVKGAWTSRGGVTVITFDRKADWLPVEMSRRLQKGETDVTKLLAAPISSRVLTQWEPVRDADGEAVFLPSVIRFAEAAEWDDDRQSELVYSFQWRVGESVREAFPRTEERDWREPLRKLFDEDFSRQFDAEIDLKPARATAR
jgi:hypothetical protein